MIPLVIILVFIVHAYLAARAPIVAMLTSLVAAVALFVVSHSQGSVLGISASHVLFPATCLMIVLTRGVPDTDNYARTIAKWVLIIIGCIIVALVSGPLLLAGPLGVFGVLFVGLFVGMIISYLLKSRDSIAVYIVSTIGACMRQNLPLAQALGSTAAGLAGKRPKIVRDIAMYLTQGNSLSTAIRQGYRKCPGCVTSLITAAERIDQVPAAIRSLEDDMTRKTQESATFKPLQPWYPVMLLFFMLSLLTGLTIFVLPRFKSIFESFGASELPLATRVLEDFQNEFWLMFPLLLLLFLVVVPIWIYVKFRPRRPEAPRFFSIIGDFVKWHLPGLRWFERNYSLLHTVEMLRLSLKAGATIDKAIANTLVLDVNGHFRKRLARWLEKVQQGQDVSVSAADSGLPDAMVWAFDKKLNLNNTPAILETVEEACRLNYNYRANLLKTFLWPWTTILVGALVGFVVLGMFMPLITIIRINTGSVLP